MPAHRRPEPRSAVLVAGGAACLALLAACTGGSGGSDGDESISGRCSAPPEAAVAAIQGGLKAGLGLADAALVKSDDYNRVFFVSARITGASGEPIATWAVNDPDDVGDLIFSVTEPAKRNSDFSTANNSFSGSDDGVSESQECAEGR